MQDETKMIEYDSRRSDNSISDMVREMIETENREKRRLGLLKMEMIDTMIQTDNGEKRTITMYCNPQNGQHYISVNGKVEHIGKTLTECANRAYKSGVYGEDQYIKVTKGQQEYGRYLKRKSIRSLLAKR